MHIMSTDEQDERLVSIFPGYTASGADFRVSGSSGASSCSIHVLVAGISDDADAPQGLVGPFSGGLGHTNRRKSARRVL